MKNNKCKGKGKGNAFHVHPIKAYRGSRVTASLIINLHMEHRGVFNFTHQPFYTQGKNPGTQ
jgi:hypothetical protein